MFLLIVHKHLKMERFEAVVNSFLRWQRYKICIHGLCCTIFIISFEQVLIHKGLFQKFRCFFNIFCHFIGILLDPTEKFVFFKTIFFLSLILMKVLGILLFLPFLRHIFYFCGSYKAKLLQQFYWISSRSSHRRCSVRKGVLRNFAKFIGNCQCQSLFLIKVAGLRPLLKKRLWVFSECSPVNFAKFVRTPFYRTPLGDCFCSSSQRSSQKHPQKR